MHTPFYIGFIFDAAQENGWLLIEVKHNIGGWESSSFC